MLIVIITVVFGVAFAIFATQNTGLVSVQFGPYSLTNIPIYALVLATAATTLFVAGFLYVVKSLSSSLTISEKEDEIKKTKEEEAELTKEVHKLELENTKLKAELGEEDVDEDSL